MTARLHAKDGYGVYLPGKLSTSAVPLAIRRFLLTCLPHGVYRYGEILPDLRLAGVRKLPHSIYLKSVHAYVDARVSWTTYDGIVSSFCVLSREKIVD